jgi:hypothetical protein
VPSASVPPASGPPTARPPLGDAPHWTRRIDLRAAIPIAAGTVLCLLAFTVLNWYGTGDDFARYFGLGKSHFGQLDDDVHMPVPTELIGAIHFGISKLYFGWLGWVLLGTSAVLAVAASIRGTTLLRVSAAAVAGLAFLATVWAVHLFSFDQKAIDYSSYRTPTWFGWFGLGGPAMYAALAGFLLLGAGAVLARPSRR